MARPTRKLWTALALAALSGLLTALACPPVGLWPLAFVAWAPLLVALHDRSPRDAFWLGAAQGLVLDVVAVRWLPDVIRTFAGHSWILCAGIALALHAYGAGRPAVLAWLAARARRNGWPPGAAFVLAVGATEAFFPLLFPWTLGVATVRTPVLMQLAELGGPILVGLPLAMGSVAIAELAWARMDGRPLARARIGVALLGPAGAIVFGAVRIPTIEQRIAEAPEARVAIVQGNIPHAGATLERSLAIHRDATARLESEERVDLVVWPETALSGILTEGALEGTLARMVAAGNGRAALSAPIITGAMLRREPDSTRDAAWSNSAVLFADGAVRGVYDKMHPLAFGEYLPLGDVFPRLHDFVPNAGRVKSGTTPVALPLGEHRILPLICYEDILAPETNDAVARTDPDLLVNLTNDSWFGRSDAAMVHLALAQLRAVEHRRYLVRATNSGISAFVDPVGRATGLTPLMEPATRVGTVRWMRARTVYERIGDAPWWCAAAIVLAMALVARPRPR